MLCELIQQLELETKYPNIQSFKHGSNWLFSKIKNNLYVLNNKCFNFFRHVFFLEELILHFFRFVFSLLSTLSDTGIRVTRIEADGRRKKRKTPIKRHPMNIFLTPPHLHQANPKSTLFNVFFPWGVLWREGTDHVYSACKCCNLADHVPNDLSEWTKFRTLQLVSVSCFCYVSALLHICLVWVIQISKRMVFYLFLSVGARAQVSCFFAKFRRH